MRFNFVRFSSEPLTEPEPPNILTFMNGLTISWKLRLFMKVYIQIHEIFGAAKIIMKFEYVCRDTNYHEFEYSKEQKNLLRIQT